MHALTLQVVILPLAGPEKRDIAHALHRVGVDWVVGPDGQGRRTETFGSDLGSPKGSD